MVESALTLVLFFMLLFGIVGFGRAMWAYSWVSHAAREATRWASVRGKDSGQTITSSSVDDYVKAHTLGLSAAAVTTTTIWQDAKHAPGTPVTVTVHYSLSQIVPWVPAMTVSSTSQMVIAQ